MISFLHLHYSTSFEIVNTFFNNLVFFLSFYHIYFFRPLSPFFRILHTAAKDFLRAVCEKPVDELHTKRYNGNTK